MKLSIEHIDQLAEKKSFDMLNNTEKQFILEHFNSEQEYTDYRNFISLSQKAIQAESIPELDPGLELRVIEHMKLHTRPSNDQKQNSIVTSILGLFTAQSLGFKTSMAMAAIVGSIFFSINDTSEGISIDNPSIHDSLADSSIDAFQDSNFYRVDSSAINASF